MSTSAPDGSRSQHADTSATRLMGALFALGATGFVVGPLGAYADRVGARADALTFLIASVLFTGGGLTQSWLAYPERRAHRGGLLAWRGAWIQSVGTLLFNLMTVEALRPAASDPHYDFMVWTPNALGSVCFLISGVLLYLSAPRAGWLPRPRAAGWWEAPVNLLGCVLFGASAIAGYAIGSSGKLVDLTIANWTTTLGAVCFLAVGLAPLIVGMTFKVPRLSRVVVFEAALQRRLAAAGQELEEDARRDALATERGVKASGYVVANWERETEQDLARVEHLVERELEDEREDGR
jgi:hypothetical protein